ncbi:MAG: YebY family protein [Comamonas sp.]|nr:YebY family protein [Comamonas sp.]
MIKTVWITTLALLVCACGGSPSSVEITAAELGDKWPLKSDKATLRCTDGARLLEIDGMAYALNGKALTAGLPRPDAVLKTPDTPGLGELTDRAGALCAK